MVECLHFTYQSIGNFAKLLTTITYEKNHSARDIAIWHERFDNAESDELFEQFLVELFPEGQTLDVEDIELVMNYAERFLEKDERAQEIRNNYVKRNSKNWVHFKIDNVVYPCEFAQHSSTVTQICVDYFKDFEHVDLDYLNKFILENFEIRSDNTTIQQVAQNTRYIGLEIMRRNRKGLWKNAWDD